MIVQYKRVIRVNEISVAVRPHDSWVILKCVMVSCVASCLVGFTGLTQAATTITTTTSFDYDTASGLLKKTIVEPGDSNLCLVTEYKPDAYGHQQEIITRNCDGSPAVADGASNEAPAPMGLAVFDARKTRNDYSSDQRFITKTTNALEQSENKTYDPRFGTIATLRGPNELTTSWTYDGLGRKTLETRADGTKTKWDYVFCTYPGYPTWTWPAGSMGAPVGAATGTCETVPANFHSGGYSVGPSAIRPVYYVQATPLTAGNAPNGVYTRVYYDTLGREVRTETQGFDGSGSSQLVYQDTSYELDGNVNVETLPYTPGVSPRYAVGYTKDVLGRTTRQLELDAAGGSASTWTTYSGLTTTVTDPKGFRTTQVKNVAGQVEKITDAKGGDLLRAYDPLGNLARTTDARGNVISIVYDARGRKTELYDPDLGAWTYVYNAAGDLAQQTDAKHQVTTHIYDKLGRMTRRTENDLTSDWYYDDRHAPLSSPCSMSIGKLCEATAGNAYKRRHSYDTLGRPSSVTTYRNSTAYAASVAYDPMTGRVSSQTYPTGLQVNSTYTPLGYPWRVIDARNGLALWTAQSQDAQGHLLQYQYGNGVDGNGLVTNNTFFKDGRIKTTQAGAGGAVQNLVYGYDLNRNINTRIDLGTSVTASYIYDELNRIKDETRSGGGLGSPQVIGWDYDDIGNMIHRSESGTTNIYNYNTSGLGSRRPHAVGSVSGSVNGVAAPAYIYDDNGNLTSGAGRTVVWNSANMVESITAGAAQLSFRYSPEHERYEETYSRNGALQRTTVYVNPSAGAGLFYEEESGVAGTKMKHYVSAGGSTVAMIVCTAMPCATIANTSTQYWHQDHLGSVSAITNEAGDVIERMAYEPFGKRRNSNGVTDTNGTLTPSSTDRGYTEHEHMDEIGLINMNGRVYDPGLGRFMSADPTIPDPNSSQSYNRYSYAQGNPLRMLDPTGFTEIDFGDGLCLGCDTPTVEEASYGSSDGWGYATLSGDLSGFSTGSSTDPLASYSMHSIKCMGPCSLERVEVVGSQAAFDKENGSWLADAKKTLGNWLDNGVHAFLAADRRDFDRTMNAAGPGSFAIAPLGRMAQLTEAERAAAQTVARMEGAGAATAAKGLAGVPGRVGSRINLSNEGMEHVISAHLSGKANKSQFSLSEAELRSVLSSRAAVGSPVVRSVESADGIRYIREFDAGRAIGTDKFNGNQATSVMTIMTDRFGNLVSTFPGLLK